MKSKTLGTNALKKFAMKNNLIGINKTNDKSTENKTDSKNVVRTAKKSNTVKLGTPSLIKSNKGKSSFFTSSEKK
jgi:hypothetical protein